MAKAPPKKGSIEWVSIDIEDDDGNSIIPDEYKDVQIGIKHVGAHKVRMWGLEMDKLFGDERANQLKGCNQDEVIEHLRGGLREIAKGEGGPGDLADIAKRTLEQDAKPQSREFLRAWTKLQDAVLREVVGGVRGLDETPEDKVEPALHFCEYMGDQYESAVFRKAQEVQSLNLRQQFRSSGSGE